MDMAERVPTSIAYFWMEKKSLVNL
jgi:hypothetical protein